MFWRRVRIRARRILRRIFRQQDPPARIARGMAAGFFAAALPLPGLQIPTSLLMAWAVRGNKVVSLFPQMLVNPLTFLPVMWLQYEIGARLWPGRAASTQEALCGVQAALNAWSWTSPAASAREFFSALGELGHESLGPLLLGALLTGALAAAVSYPLTALCVWTWRRRRRARQLARGWGRAPRPFLLPAGEETSCAKALARYALHPERFLRAESVELLFDGAQAFPAMLQAIEGARRSLVLETYILSADRTGLRFLEALEAAARRGVAVRLLYDYIGSLGLRASSLQPLLAAGAGVAVYHPLVWMRPSWAVNRRDHRKILVVDEELGFTGGLNLAQAYAAVAEGGEGWRDTHVRLSGRAASGELLRLFEYAWRRAIPLSHAASPRSHLRYSLRARLERPVRLGHRPDDGPACARTEERGVAVRILGNQEFRHRRLIRRAYLHAIRNARRYILMENAYFIPDPGLRRALARAVRRGVAVAVAVARHSDVAVAAHAARNLYGELLAAGVRIFEWPRGMLHAKTAVIDDAWALVGSYNFDHRSLFHNLEAAAVVADPAVARALRDQTLNDIALCHEVTQEEHEARPIRNLLREAVAYSFRYWL